MVSVHIFPTEYTCIHERRTVSPKGFPFPLQQVSSTSLSEQSMGIPYPSVSLRPIRRPVKYLIDFIVPLGGLHLRYLETNSTHSVTLQQLRQLRV